MSIGDLAPLLLQSSLAVPALSSIVYYAGLVLILILAFDYLLLWFERRVIAAVQLREGPGVGAYGILQNLADFVKLVSMGRGANEGRRAYALLLPAMLAISIVLIFLLPVLPSPALASVSLGLLLLLVAMSFFPLMRFLSGVSENGALAGIGAQRSSLMLLGYEIPLIIVAATVGILANTYNLAGIMSAQAGAWFILKAPLGFVIFMIALLAWLGRSPFDLEDANSEISSGWVSGVGGPYYSISVLTDYTKLFLGGLIVSVLFLGGGAGPVLPQFVWLLIKSLVIALFVVLVRATAVRTSIGRFLRFGFLILTPLALINLIVTMLIFVSR